MFWGFDSVISCNRHNYSKTIDGQDVCSFKFAHCKKGLAVVTFVVDVDEKKKKRKSDNKRYSFIAVLGTG